MSPTKEYIKKLLKLKSGELGLLRVHAKKRLNETVDGFDLFTGLWWPLRQKSQRAPRREVAWLIAKLYAFRPVPYSSEDTLAKQLRKFRTPTKKLEEDPVTQRFDKMLMLPINKIEPVLQWALNQLNSRGLNLDWVKRLRLYL